MKIDDILTSLAFIYRSVRYLCSKHQSSMINLHECGMYTSNRDWAFLLEEDHLCTGLGVIDPWTAQDSALTCDSDSYRFSGHVKSASITHKPPFGTSRYCHHSPFDEWKIHQNGPAWAKKGKRRLSVCFVHVILTMCILVYNIV